MQTLNWCKNTLKNEAAQQHLEKAVQILLEGPLQHKGDYAKEKAINTFCELICFMESSLMYQLKIHPQKIDYIEISMNQTSYIRNYTTVENVVKKEITRNLLRFTTFLSENEEDYMIDVNWENNKLRNEDSQKLLESRIQSLLKTPGFLIRSQHAKEAVIEAFTELIRHLENSLLFQRDIHPSNAPMINDFQRYFKEKKEVKDIVQIEIRRQFRNYLLFL
ncbi:hypothetical protein [Bacillus thuringiensis]|uniref:hypothetical protein n=1 Tax=Bacillus thuringiensis TaxID=1428 RepID=UPI0021D6980D|nr:hypothetical protein [Bacillus thuringiensis]MCU7667438.1 hypothetical protein [Bacillus thuringiensis]